ncbi:hypothetical protein DPMN_057458 [Dreissena polymorpha]|uniref:Uncharacterized protein n=1 Tax=Dreissena polymorpha TaxID=45954 RepID=A0A9D4C054_DREPO|nr:hypothetical protein DPMN_057458 [Dreissena polymorpha]
MTGLALGEMRNDDTEILRQSGLLWAADNSSSMWRDFNSFSLSIQIFFSEGDLPLSCTGTLSCTESRVW